MIWKTNATVKLLKRHSEDKYELLSAYFDPMNKAFSLILHGTPGVIVTIGASLTDVAHTAIIQKQK